MKKKDTIKKKLRKLSELNIDSLIDIAILEGICLPLDIWEFPYYLYFSNMMHQDTLLLEFHQKRKKQNFYSDTIVFCYNFQSFYFYWYFKNAPLLKETRNLSIETIKYLIENKYDLPFKIT